MNRDPLIAPAAADVRLISAFYDDETAAELIEELQREYVVRYGSEDDTPLDLGEFSPPGGAFLLAVLGDEVVGCAGLRRHDNDTAELKRMFVRAAFRRRGLGRILLQAVERTARDAGYRRLVLETGTAQPEAIELYVSAGYETVEDFGYYRGSPSVRSFAKPLSSP